MGIFDKVTEKIQQTRTAIRPKFMSVSDEEIKKYLAVGEDLVATITQAVSTSAKTILLSNERLIIFESGIMKSSFKDYYFRDIKDVKFETSAFSESTIYHGNLKPVIIRCVIKRKLKIAFKKPVKFLQSIFSGEKAA